MNQHTMQFLDIIKTGSLEQTQYFYSLYKQCININTCAERPFRLACSRGYVDIASWLYYEVSNMTINITAMNHDAIHEAISSKSLSLDQKIRTFHFLETIYRGIEEQWFNIGRILEYAIIEESYDFAQYILQRYGNMCDPPFRNGETVSDCSGALLVNSERNCCDKCFAFIKVREDSKMVFESPETHMAYDEIYGYAYNCFEHACINRHYIFADKIRKMFDIIIPEDSAIYMNPDMQEYADYISSEMMMKGFEMMKV